MAEVAQRLAAVSEQLFGGGFAAYHVGLELLERGAVEAAVRERVVAELEAGVEPHVERREAQRRVLSRLARAVQLVLVDEADDRHAVRLEGGEQLARVVADECRTW